MNSRSLFSFRTPTTNKDYLSLYRWVKLKNDTDNIDTINLKDSMSGILSKIADCPALKINKDKNQLSFQENMECNALYLELLENISDVLMTMPNYLLKQLPGFTEALYNDIKDAISKLKWLQNNDNASTTKTPIILNQYNIQTNTTKGDLNETTNLNDISNLGDVLLEEDNITEEPHSVTNNANSVNEITYMDDDDFPEVNHSASTSYVDKGLHSQIDPSSDQINQIYNKGYTENVERQSVTNNANTNIGTINTDDDYDFSESYDLASPSYADNTSDSQIDPSSDQINQIYNKGYTENVERQSVTNNANTNIGTINTDDDYDFSESYDLASPSYADNTSDSQIDPSSDQINQIYNKGYTENVKRQSVTNNANTNIGTTDADDDYDFSESYDLASPSYADNTSDSQIDPSSDHSNHSSGSGCTRNVEPDTTYKQTIDNSVYFHDHIYLNSMLKSHFRLQNFREKQIEAINAARFGHNCFIVMPAGAGKSLCYQMPAILSAGVTIVISPLMVIDEQIQQLSSLKIKVAHLAGKLGKKEETLIYNALSIDEPDVKLLYVTPEKLMKNNELNDVLVSLNDKNLLTRFVIGEAQCVLQGSVSYRVAYSILKELRAKFGMVPVTALTSCATKRTIEDVEQQLGMSDTKIFRTSLNRPNISYNISKRDEINGFDEHVAMMIIEKYPRQSGILYCLTRKKCEEMAETLKKNGVTATAYHSNLSEKTRKKAKSDWILNNCYVVCVTISYGMGINKPDVRFVLYCSLPPSIEGYYKGAGCAGRDGKNADCHLFYSLNDVKQHLKIFNLNSNKSDPDLEKNKENSQKQLTEVYDFCTNGQKCRRLALLEYFNDKYNNYNCGTQHACDVCRNKM